MQYGSKVIAVPLSVFHRMAESVGDPKGDLLFIFNTTRCGSTLMMKVVISLPIFNILGLAGILDFCSSDRFLSVLLHCWLGDRKGVRPVKKDWVLVCW